MSNLKMCNCQYCRYGRKKFGNPKMIRSLKKAHRQEVKRLLKFGQYDLIKDYIRVPYTD